MNENKIEALIQRARKFIELSDHSPGQCMVLHCDECERFQDAREELETALDVMEKQTNPTAEAL